MTNSKNNSSDEQYFDFPTSEGPGFAAEQYGEFLDRRVVIYYVDEKS